MSWNVVDYVEKPINIDYSEKVTEPGQVLSMREIYNRYVAMGVDPLHGDLVDDDDDDKDMYTPEVDEPLDALQQATMIRQSASQVRKHSARSRKESEQSSDEQHDESSSGTKQSEETDEGKS